MRLSKQSVVYILYGGFSLLRRNPSIGLLSTRTCPGKRNSEFHSCTFPEKSLTFLR